MTSSCDRLDPIAKLVACLEEAYEIFGEPALRALHHELCARDTTTAPTPSAPVAWFEQDLDRFNREARALARLLEMEPGSTPLGTADGHLMAVGLLTLGNGTHQKVAIRYPADYPESPPIVYLHRATHLLPLPLELAESWTRYDDAGLALDQARTALEDGVADTLAE
jgi:hypothetical protein